MLVPQDIGRVLLNLINNAFYAVNEKVKQIGNSFKPLVVITTSLENDKINIIVSDNGNGIPDSVIEQDFPTLLYYKTNRTGNRAWIEFKL